MWLKLFFLLLYFILLFMLARLFEAVVWYETGVFATQLVDPVTLSYKKLKTILECRGLGYSGLPEKKDVSELVEKSGELTQGELYSAIKKEKEQTEEGDASSTHFSGEMHFYELVEDTKDGIWLVQVIAQDREALLSHSNWGKMVQKVSQFGIRTGTFNCSHDYRPCIRRGWQRSTLIMSVPQTSASKGKVVLKEYTGRRIEPDHIFRWMTSHMAHRVKTLSSSDKLLEEWNSDSTRTVKMFMFAHLPQPPAFFSSLSVKFTGRIEFIFVDVRQWDNHSSLSEIGVTQTPAYILKMPEGIYRYGNGTGEFLSLAAMDSFLRSVQPEVNDLFVLSLVLINLLAWMDLFITQALMQLCNLSPDSTAAPSIAGLVIYVVIVSVPMSLAACSLRAVTRSSPGQRLPFHSAHWFGNQGATVKRFVVLIRTLGTYNSILLVSWLPVLGLIQLPYLDILYGFSLKLLRYADTTTLASLVRADWTFYSSHPALFLSSYLAHGLLVDYFEKKRRCGNRIQEDSTTNLEWLASLWDWYTSYLLHPIASLQQVPADFSDWDDDPNFFFERLAYPDFWLRPLVNMDYMKGLPTWRFRAVCVEGCGGRTDDETDGSHSDTDGEGRAIAACRLGPSGECTLNRKVCSMCLDSRSCCGHCKEWSASADQVQKKEPSHHHHCDCSAWPGDMLPCSECVVCLENFVSRDVLMGLPCGHVFHQRCIVVWLSAGRHCCPVCRWPSYKKKRQPTAQSAAENALLDS